ncbi:hypothetical protein [Microbacterium thalli]|uniref:hypothetical protein n=1 Tax=Microbacterium thalli TaxID=3027921 RepID=UPI002364FFA4|nr:hypothetical protein [Microbacterium thalli]MDD7929881.1 hypothetical protein [Microbacterium thalli]
MARRDIIKYLVEKESVLALARDIASNGLSPLDKFGAIAAPEGGYTILEGNRRLCGLILLHDPSLAPSKERKSFDRLHKTFNPDNVSIELIVFEDKEEADLWIDRKHAGPGNGVGPRPWNTVQLARRYGDKTGNGLALALLEYAQDKGIVTKADSEGILTTITRFVSNPFVRSHGLGITTGRADEEFKFLGTQALFDRRLAQLLQDIISHSNGATSRTSSSERKTYAEQHLVTITDADLDDDGQNEPAGQEGGGTGSGGTGGGGSTTEDPDDEDGGSNEPPKPGAKPPHPSKRPKLIPDTFTPSLRSNRLRRVLDELRKARKDSPLSAALMVRVFLESVTVAYLETREEKISHHDKLHLLVHRVLTRIEKDKKAGDVSLTKAENSSLGLLKSQVSEAGYVYSAFYLGLVAHGSAFPEWETLTIKWDEIEPILAFIASNAEPPISPV